MSKFCDVIVVGAGIMGATIGEAFRQFQSRDVLIIDDDRPLSGTKASGGSVKPSHLTGLDRDGELASLGVLEKLWGLHKENFVIRPSGGLLKADVYQVDMDRVMGIDVMAGTVTKVGHAKGGSPAVVVGEKVIICNLLIVAAGMGCVNLLPGVFGEGQLFAKQGVSFLFDGKIKESFVQTWAPYKQVTVHPITVDGKTMVWGSDGSALKPENWDDSRTAECLNRISKAAGLKPKPFRTNIGLRPFHKDKSAKPCFMKEVSNGVWAVTGAGKFGGIAAGWAASRLLAEV